MDDDLKEQFAEAAANGDFTLARKIGAKWALNAEDSKDIAQRSKAYLDILKAAGMKMPQEENVDKKEKSMVQSFLQRKKLTRQDIMSYQQAAPAVAVAEQPEEEEEEEEELPVVAQPVIPLPEDKPVKNFEIWLSKEATRANEEKRQKYFDKRRDGFNHHQAAVSSRGQSERTQHWKKQWDHMVLNGLDAVKV